MITRKVMQGVVGGLIFLVPCSAAFGARKTKTQTLDWPHLRGPTYNNISQEKNWLHRWPAEGPKRLWSANVGAGYSAVSVAGGRVYTMGWNKSTGKDTVFCFDAKTGKEIWKHSYPAPGKFKRERFDCYGPHATPTVDGNRIYTFSRDAQVYCLDTDRRGKVVWYRDLKKDIGARAQEWGFAGSVLILGGLAILDVGPAGLALNKKTGKIVWTSGPADAGYASPIPFQINGQRGIAIFSAKGLVGVDAARGRRLWFHPYTNSKDINAADPVISGNRIFISSLYSSAGESLVVRGGKVRMDWSTRKMRSHCNGCVLWKGHMYGFNGYITGKGTLRCIDFKTGAVRWDAPRMHGSLVIADEKLLILTTKGELITAEASPKGYKEISRAKVISGRRFWTIPVLSNGRIYCRGNVKGELVCLDVKGK